MGYQNNYLLHNIQRKSLNVINGLNNSRGLVAENIFKDISITVGKWLII